jgi:hypothetical protein
MNEGKFSWTEQRFELFVYLIHEITHNLASQTLRHLPDDHTRQQHNG